MPAHSSNQNKSLSLRKKLTLSSGRKSDTPFDHTTEVESPNSPDSNAKQNNTGKSDALSPPYASIDDFKLNLKGVPQKGKLKHRSSSCDCLDMCDATINDDRLNLQDAMYDKLVPLGGSSAVDDVVYDRLGPKEGVKSNSSSPDPTDDKTYRRASYSRKAHMYEYIEEMEDRGSEKSRSNSPDGMEHPSNWTKTLPVNIFRRETTESVKMLSRPSFSKETNTLSRRKQLPLQQSEDTQAKYSSASKVHPPRLSRENSVDVTDNQRRLTSSNATPTHTASSADSTELLSSTESAPESKRESNGSASSMEQHSSALIQARREHSNSPIHRVTHEAVEIRKKADTANVSTESQSDSLDHKPPPIPERETSPKDSLRGRKPVNSKGSPPLPPRTQEPRFTVPLPHAQFDFVKPLPPRPKMLYSPGLSYAAVTFSNEDSPVYSHVEPVVNNIRSSVKISQTASDVSYASVDFQMTAGLQRTSEQVADHQKRIF